MQRQAALAFLFSRLPHGERETQLAATLGAVQRGELPLDDLLVAEGDGNLVGVLFTVRQPGRTAFVWPPVVSSRTDHRAVTDLLLRTASARLDEQGVLFSQAVLELNDTDARDDFTRNGFPHAADLLFLRHDLCSISASHQECPPHVCTYNDSLHDRFARVIEQTYVGTLDCPVLGGVRTGKEALAAHQAAGTFSPSRWLLYRDGETDVGVLLVADWRENDAWEILYFGVIPAARGRGLGCHIVQDALAGAKSAGRSHLLLTVDAANGPALAIYDTLGFTENASRAVHLRIAAAEDRLLNDD